MSRLVCRLLLAWIVLASAQAQPTPPKHPTPIRPGAALTFPQLGEEMPDALLKRPAAKPCDVGEGLRDPCATISIGNARIVVAWDSATRRVTYLYSATLETDDDIRAGDVLGIAPESPITPFPAPGIPHRFVTSDWCDTDNALSGQSLWCAVMVPARPKSGKVLGFVQSLYLNLPLWGAAPMHRTASRRHALP
ncbi:MAG: hypothetical protein NVSMB62_03140 [Acidobacteriaceae bacterium]